MKCIALLACCLSLLAQEKPKPVLWQDPGPIDKLDLANGPGGPDAAPKAPYRLEKEDSSGSSAKLLVRDANNRQWSVKFGEEAKPEVFGSRLAWAMGYIVEPSYLVAEGTVANPGTLTRAAKFVSPEGHFSNGRFQARGDDLKFLPGTSWSWQYNPFVGTHELNGLKILMMMVSNWDNKDGRDAEEGTNALMFDRTVNGEKQYAYVMNDWGQILGRWGSYFRRTNWNCPQFTTDNGAFIKGVSKSGEISFSYRGRHTGSFTSRITTSDAQWLLQRLGQVTDAQFAAMLRSAGASPEESQCFTTALRQRIDRLRQVAKP